MPPIRLHSHPLCFRTASVPYLIRKSIDIDFAHHIRGHQGACINIHGHTWKFEVDISAQSLDKNGFVLDFSHLKRGVLKPCHTLLDHSLAIGAATYAETESALEELGGSLLRSRSMGQEASRERLEGEFGGARNTYPGGMKVAIFPFSPTSERMAEWLFHAAASVLDDERVNVSCARVYETLHPVEAIGEYRASS